MAPSDMTLRGANAALTRNPLAKMQGALRSVQEPPEVKAGPRGWHDGATPVGWLNTPFQVVADPPHRSPIARLDTETAAARPKAPLRGSQEPRAVGKGGTEGGVPSSTPAS